MGEAGKQNEATYKALPKADQNRWDEQLFGDPRTDEGVVRYSDPATGASGSVPSKGCYADARKQLYGTLEDYLRIRGAVDALNRQLQIALDAAPAIAALEGEWVACIGAKGYADRFSQRVNAFSFALELYKSGDSETARAQEAAIAAADAECVNEVEYSTRYESARAEAVEQFERAHRDEIERLTLTFQELDRDTQAPDELTQPQQGVAKP